ncbi:sugar ABC transporter substrate-binding protein [Streptomyces sp. NBC_00576]|uniref:sugar ABC transporter substrate-binding protein n=1 Tax=Streptomyces sp. NBC_00576 TaxID=2903665 RepID=UPI002E7FE321|nr:extracellular solute-binding protein [Streptomyces sp. NBC_00576]WUB73732.1 extracellular solute-binding protein [Streptomyces sp. NBC_00576]
MRNPRTRWAVGAVALLSLSLSACGGSGFDDSGTDDSQESAGPASIKVLIASSGDAETKAVKDASDAWATKSGNKATVTQAQDISQQLGQGFASNNPPDVFYVDAKFFATYASAGSLEPYGDTFPGKDDFYPALRQAFTYDGKFYCVPKDFSTLGLQINTTAWSKAGLTDADIPTTWEQLAAVAKKLTTGKQVGFVLGDTRDRIGAFMVQAGGWVTNKDATKVTADSPENLKALEYVRSLLADGSTKYPKQLDSGWSGEAFGKQKAAMTIEGNWIAGAMKNDYPDVKYKTVPLPTGPAGKGTLAFTQCWGIAAKSKHKAAALDFVKAMTAKDAELSFAQALGVMPSRQSASADYLAQSPQDKAFIDGATYAQAPVNVPKIDQVLTDFDTGLQSLPDADPKQILARLQKNAQAVVGQ